MCPQIFKIFVDSSKLKSSGDMPIYIKERKGKAKSGEIKNEKILM